MHAIVNPQDIPQEAFDRMQMVLKPALKNPEEMRKLFTSLDYLGSAEDQQRSGEVGMGEESLQDEPTQPDEDFIDEE